MHRLVRNPIFLDLDQATAALGVLIDIKGRQTQLFVRIEHPFKVFINPKHRDAVVHCPVRLCSFKALDCVMECRVCRVKLEGYILDNFWLLPAAIFFVVVDIQHVVGCNATECVDVFRTRFCLQILTWNECQIARLKRRVKHREGPLAKPVYV